jgi:hypothetical protein
MHGIENQTAKYFRGVEVQYENSNSKRIIIRALNDILTLSEQELKAKRYPDYAGREENWDLPKLIYSYFVPDDSQKIMGKNLYKDLKTDEVQRILEDILVTLT